MVLIEAFDDGVDRGHIVVFDAAAENVSHEFLGEGAIELDAMLLDLVSRPCPGVRDRFSGRGFGGLPFLRPHPAAIGHHIDGAGQVL